MYDRETVQQVDWISSIYDCIAFYLKRFNEYSNRMYEFFFRSQFIKISILSKKKSWRGIPLKVGPNKNGSFNKLRLQVLPRHRCIHSKQISFDTAIRFLTDSNARFKNDNVFVKLEFTYMFIISFPLKRKNEKENQTLLLL